MLRAIVSFASILTLLQPALSSAADGANERSNPLLTPWPGPHGGLPPFDVVRVEDFVPALEAAMAVQRREIAAIIANAAAPTFINTVEALERSRQLYWRVLVIYFLWRNSMNSPAMQEVERQMEPRLASFKDEINQNERLFARVESVYQSAALKRLTAEQKRLVWSYRTTMVKQGARLNTSDKGRVAKINERLAALQTTFSQNVLAEEETPALVLDDRDDLAGLNAADVDGAAREAARREMPLRWVIANRRSTVESFLTNSSRRDLREKVWRAFNGRGDHDGARNNLPVVTEILALRTERAKLMGFDTYAHWKLVDAMARTPQATLDLMMQVWQPALAQTRKQLSAMQELADADSTSDASVTMEPWDLLYYREKLRQATYKFDASELMSYLRFDKVRDAMFWAAGRLYGLRFQPIGGVPVFSPEVTVYEVFGTNGRHVGLLYLDPLARPGKESGAWMRSYRLQQRMIGNVTPLVSLNLNYKQGNPGEPVLLSWDDAVVLFHEFGHALHGLCSEVTYPLLAGPFAVSDFGEAPAVANEQWLPIRPVLERLVNQEGRPLPPELIDKLQKAQQFDKPLEEVFFLASAFLDMKMHLNPSTATANLKAFERDTLAALGAPTAIVPRHRIAHFGHVFAGEWYAAGYYGYLWADVIASDIFDAFLETGDPFDPKTASRYLKTVLSVGNSVDPGEAFRRYRGRDPSPDHFLRAAGLVQ